MTQQQQQQSASFKMNSMNQQFVNTAPGVNGVGAEALPNIVLNSPQPSSGGVSKKTPTKQSYKGPLGSTQGQTNQSNGAASATAERVKTHQINKSLGGGVNMQQQFPGGGKQYNQNMAPTAKSADGLNQSFNIQSST